MLRALVDGDRVWLLATLRSDRYADLQLDGGLLALKRAGATYDLPPPGPAEIADIVKGPARAAGLTFAERAGISLARVLVEAAPKALPGGTLTMGSPANEKHRVVTEGPQRQVTIEPFAIGKHEVTFAEWDACVAGGECNGYRPDDGSTGDRRTQPVINISWQEAQAYVSWLAKQTGKPYRLPTEAEWEYAARAGTTTPFWFGKTPSTAQANYDGRTRYGPGSRIGEYRRQTVPVGSLPANPWGLYEMHGNVWELVEDCWHSNYKNAPPDSRAWIEPSCTEHVVRGGS